MQSDERNLSLVMDLYEMTMANGYFSDGLDKIKKVTFDVFYRNNPDNGGYAIFAGLEQVLELVKNFHFSKSDVAYFRSLHLFSEEFLTYLESYHFHGDIDALPEGTVMYPHEPILTVTAPMLDAQLLETAILAEINHQSLIATKTNRIVRAAQAALYLTLVHAGPTTWMQLSMEPVPLILVGPMGPQPSLQARNLVFP